MTPCDRFERENLVRFVAGEPLDAHVESCGECRAALDNYRNVAAALRQAQDGYPAPRDWEAKVWSKLPGERARRPRAPWALVLGLSAALAALVALFLNVAAGPDTLALSQSVERGPGAIVRGTATKGEAQSAAPGDVLHLVARVPRGKLGDVRLYRGTELVFQCATSPRCIRSRDGLEARVTLDRAGTYRSLAIAADKALPEASGNLDDDYAQALRSGAAQESRPLEVL